MKRYQIFISSTYTDLELERQSVLKSVLKLRYIPVGMEYFAGTNDEQFNYIKRLLDETDYYIIIIGNRYGSEADDGISYTEKEFDYAVNLGIPIIACIHSNPDILPVNKSDVNPDIKHKLNKFRDKVMHHRMVSYFSWDNPSALSAEVVVALINTINDYPRPGWERGVSYENSDLLNQINDLRIENNKLRALLDKQKSMEGKENLNKQFPWNEVRTFMGYSVWEDYKNVTIPVSMTWLQIFSILGSILLIENDAFSVHLKLDEAFFSDHEPHFYVSDLDFELIVAEFVKYGIIDASHKKIMFTKIGMQYFQKISIHVEEELNKIYARVREISIKSDMK